MNEYTFYYAALLLGFLGSFHCVGMCGPIALMLPANKLDNRRAAFFGRLFYNIGRMITYMFIGMLFGLLGAAFVLNGFQKQLSIITGIILLLVAIFTLIPSTRKKVLSVSSKMNIPFRGVLRKLFQVKQPCIILVLVSLMGFFHVDLYMWQRQEPSIQAVF
ncbi:MAG: sulfite exporter TauE/SafE family protein [Bacteroidota bacterium]|nr:MAG: sulfite exporter TauE/SafE family protein [Bacteroidota bacterium]